MLKQLKNGWHTSSMPNSTTFSSRVPISLTLNLSRRLIIAVLDNGSTTRSSITMYVTTPSTYPPSVWPLEKYGLFELGVPLYFNTQSVNLPWMLQIVLVSSDMEKQLLLLRHPYNFPCVEFITFGNWRSPPVPPEMYTLGVRRESFTFGLR